MRFRTAVLLISLLLTGDLSAGTTIFSDALSEPTYTRYLHSHIPDGTGPGWRTIKGDTWTLTKAAGYVTNPAATAPEASIFPAASDSLIQGEFYVPSGASGTYGAWIPFRGVDTNNFCLLTAYVGTSTNVRIRYTTNGGGTTTNIGSAGSVTIATNTWYTYQIDLRTAGSVIWKVGPSATWPTGSSTGTVTTSQFATGTFAGIGGNATTTTAIRFRNVSASTEATDTIVQTNGFGNLTVLQWSGTQGSLTVSGSYTGAPTDIQYRLVQDFTATAVTGHDWTILDASPSGGTFSATITDLPKGGWWNLQLRTRGAPLEGSPTLATATSYVRVGVGYVIVFSGQSNMDNYFDAPATVISAIPSVTVFYDGSGYRSMSTSRVGDGALAMSNCLYAHYQCPVALINGAHDGSAILQASDTGGGYWLSSSSTAPRATCLRYVNEATLGVNRVWYLLFGQGEADAQNAAITESSYSGINSPAQGLTDVLSYLRAQISGPAGERVPIFLEHLGRASGGSYVDAQWQAVREGQISTAAADPDIITDGHFAQSMANNLHLNSAGYVDDARTMAAQMLGLGSAPRVNYLSYSADQTRIYLHYDRTIADPGASFSNFGWRVTESGSPITISSADWRNATTVALTLAAPFADSENVLVWTQYGAADTSGTAALTLPRGQVIAVPDYDGTVTTTNVQIDALPFSQRRLKLIPEVIAPVLVP